MTELRLIFDTGTFVLIWMVQLIVYPSFLYYSKDEFLTWHKKYTQSLVIIVLPLLAGQGLSIAYHFFSEMTLFTFIQGSLITAVTLHTFIYFIPLHSQLQSNYSIELVKKLINKNWIRTIVWTLILFVDLGFYFFTDSLH